MAVGVGDPSGVLALLPDDVGAAVRPLAPIGISAAPVGSDVAISWTRRSREGWRWRDAIDVPIGEDFEHYRVTKTASGRADLVVETFAAAWSYTAAERALDLAAGAAVATISVMQLGALGVSRPATMNVATS